MDAIRRPARRERARRPAPSRPEPGRGFTLVEVLIALAVAGVLAAGILTLLLGQNRFYEHSDDSIYAQQTLRAAMDLASSELRMVSPTDLLAAEADSVSARFDLVRMVVCDTLASDAAYLFVYDTVDNANLPAAFRGTAASGPYDSTFVYADGWTGSVTAPSSTAKTTCVSNGAPDTTANALYREVTGIKSQFTTATDTLVRGALVRRYGRLTYRFAPSTLGGDLALWRNQQELVSPFETGARFRYVMRNGSVQNSVSAANLANVRAVRIEATALGEDTNRYGVQRPITYDIQLRN